MNDILKNCRLCPRQCGVNRHLKKGFCLCGDKIVISKIDIHLWEEPCICGPEGVGAFFFSGCNLHCCYCQNNAISSAVKGKEISVQELADYMLLMQEKGVSAIDLITPTHFSYHIVRSLDKIKNRLYIPVVYNCSGYESEKTLDMLNGYIDIYLPDFKYFYNSTSMKYSGAANYPETAKRAVKKMQQQTGNPIFDENKMMKKGTIIRHLVLPGHRRESIEIIKWIAENFTPDQIMISLMSQYTPAAASEFKNLERHVTKFEYNSVADVLQQYDFNGYVQDITSARESYIPDFENGGFL